MSAFEKIRTKMSFAFMLFGAVPAEVWANAQPIEGDDEYTQSTRAHIAEHIGASARKGVQASGVVAASLATHTMLDWKIVAGVASSFAFGRATEALSHFGRASLFNEILKQNNAVTWTTAPLA